MVDVPAERVAIRAAIRSALDAGFRAPLTSDHSALNDGLAARRIVEILQRLEIDDKLLKKQLAY